MPAYVALYRFTSQGRKRIKDTVKRAAQVRAENKRLGIVAVGLTLVVGAVIGGTACGGGGGGVSPEEATATAVSSSLTQWEGTDPCSLITKSEAEQVLGQSVMEPSRYPLFATENCGFRTANGGDLTISMSRVPSKDAFEEMVQADATLFKGTAEALAGLGDQAFVIEERPTSATIDILRGDLWLKVAVDLGSDLRITDSKESARAKAEMLAGKALERVP